MTSLVRPEELHRLLRYEPETGKLYWLPRPVEFFDQSETRSASHVCANWNSQNAGAEAFTALHSQGRTLGHFTTKAAAAAAYSNASAILHGEYGRTR